MIWEYFSGSQELWLLTYTTFFVLFYWVLLLLHPIYESKIGCRTRRRFSTVSFSFTFPHTLSLNVILFFWRGNKKVRTVFAVFYLHMYTGVCLIFLSSAPPVVRNNEKRLHQEIFFARNTIPSSSHLRDTDTAHQIHHGGERGGKGTVTSLTAVPRGGHISEETNRSWLSLQRVSSCAFKLATLQCATR